MNHVEAARTSLLHFHFMQAQLKKLLGYKCQHETKLDGNISSQISTNKDCHHHNHDISEFKSPYTAQIHYVLSYTHLTTPCSFRMLRTKTLYNKIWYNDYKWVGSEIEGSSYCVLQGTIPKLCKRAWDKPRKTSFKVAGAHRNLHISKIQCQSQHHDVKPRHKHPSGHIQHIFGRYKRHTEMECTARIRKRRNPDSH